jgi:hypothetical protein
MTKGENKVGSRFNPSGDDTVSKIKRAAADLIDLIEEIETHTPKQDSDKGWQRTHEIARLKAVAQTTVEESAMWAVKAATKGSPQ